ncbi:MAG: type II toxin-antitoxin system HicA family toxin [Deltaproteobacteria bacterium]|nr:type II toxin-antitoxin system HicA family toxin [Deltaproteobacteria bacterium]
MNTASWMHEAPAILRRLRELGWTSARSGKGSHEIFAHPQGSRPIPVPSHGNEIPEALARGILKQAVANVSRGRGG